MKQKLMLQSLSPLALLTIIKNFSFISYDNIGQNLDPVLFIERNLPLLIVMLFCVLWIILAIWYLIIFNVFKYADRKSGFSISNIKQREDDSLNFFLTLILPLLIDDLNTWQGMFLFFTVTLLIWGLLSKTKLFYANPVLALLGYYIAEISFKENKEKQNNSYIAIYRGKLEEDDFVEYKDITEEVLFVKEMKQ